MLRVTTTLLIAAPRAAALRRATSGRSSASARLFGALSAADAHQKLTAGGYWAVLDVRMEAEHRLEPRVPGSVCVPAQNWEHGMYLPREAFVDEVVAAAGPSATLLLLCGDGRRSELAAEQLRGRGYDCDTVDGGLESWEAAGYDVEVEDDGGLVGSWV
mmetsp:Transcript_19310/g.57369  ORF Transcript_19310/g.57369 Transcript_19310/m.57369 type:complete len:159 (-) Transcript_19310:17-493(-)